MYPDNVWGWNDEEVLVIVAVGLDWGAWGQVHLGGDDAFALEHKAGQGEGVVGYWADKGGLPD